MIQETLFSRSFRYTFYACVVSIFTRRGFAANRASVLCRVKKEKEEKKKKLKKGLKNKIIVELDAGIRGPWLGRMTIAATRPVPTEQTRVPLPSPPLRTKTVRPDQQTVNFYQFNTCVYSYYLRRRV